MSPRQIPTVLKALCLFLALILGCAGGGDQPAGETPANEKPAEATAEKAAEAEEDKAGEEPAEAPSNDSEAAIQVFAEVLGEEQVSAFEEALAMDVEDPHANLGSLAIYTQHLELAAWIYGQGMLANPEDAMLANNFGVLAHEMYLAQRPKDAGGFLQIEGEAETPVMLKAARGALENTISLNPEDSKGHNNLGFLLYDIWQATQQEGLLEAAESHLRKALELDPDNATTLAHLSQVLSALGRHDEAAEALARARDLNQLNGTVLTAQANMPEPTRQSYSQQPRECNVNYDCDNNCPRSIIGRLEFVSCEMEQSSAQMACQAGKPYAKNYNCAQEIPEWGIMIPGLHSGFSILTPFGRLDMVLQGNGQVDYRLKVNAGLGGRWETYVENRGSWHPESGLVNFEAKGGFSYNLVGGTPASDALNEYGLGPASVSAETQLGGGDGEITVKGELYGNTALEH